MSFLAWAEAAEQTPIGQAIRESAWLVPALESGHLIALAILSGAVLIVDLRLLGLGLVNHSVATIHRAARPWFYLGLLGMLSTGALLILPEALKYYGNDAFWLKLGTLGAALVFAFTIRSPVINGSIRLFRGPRPAVRAVGAISLLLWFTVTAAGRWVGFSS